MVVKWIRYSRLTRTHLLNVRIEPVGRGRIGGARFVQLLPVQFGGGQTADARMHIQLGVRKRVRRGQLTCDSGGCRRRWSRVR